jgi:hypothetical protein
MILKNNPKVNLEEIVDHALESLEEPDYTLRWKLPFLTAQRLQGAYLDLHGHIPESIPEPLLNYILAHEYKFLLPPEMDIESFAFAVYTDWEKVETPYGHNPITFAVKQAETCGITYFLPPALFPIPRIQERAQKLVNVLYCLAQNSPNGEFYITTRTAAQLLEVGTMTASRIINALAQKGILIQVRKIRLQKGLAPVFRIK